MRTSRYAGAVAGAVCLHAVIVFAGEGSSLRGLKPPAGGYDDAAAAGAFSGAGRLNASERETYLDPAPRLSRFGGSVESRRVTTGNLDVRFGLHQPVGQNVAALAEPSINTLHEVLPRYTLSTQVTRTLPGGWGLGFGVRQSEYNLGSANLLSLSAERQWGNVRGAYTLYSGREGAGFNPAHRFEVSYLYGERNTIGLSYTTGREIENHGLMMGLAAGDPRDWTLSGRHWFSPNWALTYDVLSQDQLYRRPGLRLGVSRSF